MVKETGGQTGLVKILNLPVRVLLCSGFAASLSLAFLLPWPDHYDSMDLLPGIDWVPSRADLSAANAEWDAAYSELRRAWRPVDISFGLAGLTLTMLSFALVHRSRTIRDFMLIPPVRGWWRHMIHGLILLVVMPFLAMTALFHDGARGAHPPWADSYGLPVASIIASTVTLGPVCIAVGGFLIAFMPGRVSRPMLTWAEGEFGRWFFMNALFLPISIPLLLVLGQAIYDGQAYLIPILLAALYLVFSAATYLRERLNLRDQQRAARS